jgi:hypothetical protein
VENASFIDVCQAVPSHYMSVAGRGAATFAPTAQRAACALRGVEST